MSLPDTITAHLTAEDIREGEPRNCSRCPVARAIIRTTQTWCQVDPWRATLYNDWYSEDYRHDAADFIYAFDVGQHVEPRTVTLTRVEP